MELTEKFKSVALAGSNDFNSPPFITDCLAEYTTDPLTGEKDPKKVKQVKNRVNELKKLARNDPNKFEAKKQLFKEEFERFEANQKKVDLQLSKPIPAASSDTSPFSSVLEPPSTEDPPTMSTMLRTTRGNTRASSNPAPAAAAATAGKDLDFDWSKYLVCIEESVLLCSAALTLSLFVPLAFVLTKEDMKAPYRLTPNMMLYPITQMKYPGAKKKGTKGRGVGVGTYGHNIRDVKYLKAYTNGPETLIVEEVGLVSANRHDYKYHKPVLMKGTEGDYMDGVRVLVGENLERQSDPPIWRTQVKFPPGSCTLDTENLDPGSEGNAVQVYWDSTLAKDEEAGAVKSEQADMDAEVEEFFDSKGGEDEDDDDDESSDTDDESFVSTFPRLSRRRFSFTLLISKSEPRMETWARRLRRQPLKLPRTTQSKRLKRKRLKQ